MIDPFFWEPSLPGKPLPLGAAQPSQRLETPGPRPPGILQCEGEGRYLSVERVGKAPRQVESLLQRQAAYARAEGVVARFAVIDSGGS